uniref:Uncharacterized protein n=1 Tax=Anguilla anguilla TaxID=7936 RepID=A0A0E9T515_ANGAN
MHSLKTCISAVFLMGHLVRNASSKCLQRKM